MNFAARIAEAAARFPVRIAIERVGRDGTTPTSYGALIEQAEAWSASLAAHGISRGDRVTLVGDNDAAWIAAYLGVLRLGAVAVPLDTAYSPAQIRTVVDHCGARLVCASPRYLDRAREAIAPTEPALPVLVLETVDTASFQHTAQPTIASVDGTDAAVILYTSGTTADPKGVVLTHANLEAERVAALSVVDCTELDAVLGVLPLFHALAQMANLLVPLAVGARVVFLETIDSSSLVNALQTRGITIFVCVPQFFYLIHQRVMTEVARSGAARRAMFRVLLRGNGWLRDRMGWNTGRFWFARVHHVLGRQMRLLITGGSRFDPAIGRDLYDMGFTLLNGYGLTETSGAATVQRPRDRFTTSVGPPLAGVDVTIDSAPADVDSEQTNARTGEILIRGPIVMREYFNRPDATSEALRDGWLHTGDLGFVDAGGRVHITGRKKEIIVLSSGKNLYPEEIEAHYRSTFIKELCVLGLARPDEPSAERLHAVIVPDADALRARGAVNVRELIRFELEGRAVHLPAHKRILSYDIWQTPLPRTTTGKLRRHEIERLVRAQHAADATAHSQPAAPPSDADLQWLERGSNRIALATIATVVRRPAVALDANLELDLGLDSMERVELLTRLEHVAGHTVPPEVRATIFTVRQLIEAVARDDGASATEAADAGSQGGWQAILGEPADPSLVAGLDRARNARAIAFFLFIRTFRTLARVCVGFKPGGLAHLPRNGPAIICPNHQSYIDGLFITAALPFSMVRRIFLVGAAEYYQTRGARALARLANIVPVDPDANLVAAMQVCAAGLRSGHVLVLFPEGERTIDGDVKTFRKGAAILSSNLGVPIVPAALDGLHAIWPRSCPLNWRGLLPWRSSRVSLAFGSPMNATPEQPVESSARLRDAVEQMLRELRDNERH